MNADLSKCGYIIIGMIFLSYTSMYAQDDRIEERQSMVQRQLISRGIQNKRVLSAMRTVPRHLFVPENNQRRAYWDQALPIGYNQTISQPFVVAITLEKLQLTSSHKVLEVGTGSGYLAAVLGELVDSVVTIEIVGPLEKRARLLLAELGYENIKVVHGDGFLGAPDDAPFDRIIVSAASEVVPPPLIEQLKIGGKLLMPLGEINDVQTLTMITKLKNGKLSFKKLEKVRFVPLTRN